MTGRHHRRCYFREGLAKALAQPRTVGKAELVVVGAIPAGECTVDGGGEGGERLAPAAREAPAGPWRHCAKATGTRGNIDHLVIAIEIRDRGGLFRTDFRLTVGGRDASSLADGMGWQVEAVLTVLGNHGVEPAPTVAPVLCFLEVEWPLFRAPDSFRGVWIESARSLARVLTSSSVLTVAQADELAAPLSEHLPAK